MEGSSPQEALEPQLASAFSAVGYRLLRALGHGGFGTVYLALRERDQREVAIKLAHRDVEDGAARLAREVAALSLVRPPHVPEVLGRGAMLGQFYVVLEYIATPTLAERLAALSERLPLSTFAAYADGILRAVEAIHRAGITHRDLKPENLFVDDRGRVKVIDFGLARDRSMPPELVGSDDVGTAEYMSPEQVDGLVDAHESSDIYSLGVLFYELLSGAPPFWGKSAEVREAHRSRLPAPLWSRAQCSRELDAVVRRCLAKDRRRRFESVAALRGALDLAVMSQRKSNQSPWTAHTTLGQVPEPLRERRRPSVPRREKRTLGLVFFESRDSIANIQATLSASGGQLVHTSGIQHVAGFGHDVGENPARLALLAAQRLHAAKIAQRLLVDVAQVSLQARPDGSHHIFSHLFARRDHYPAATDPSGVMLSASTVEILPHLKVTPADGRANCFVLAQSPKEPTTFGAQIAPLVGRESLLQELLDSARRALKQNEPTVHTVYAEGSGYGRTHLASILTHQLERSELAPEVIRLVPQPALLGAIPQTLAMLLMRVLKLPSEPPKEDCLPLLRERIGPASTEAMAAAAAFALGWIDGEHPEVRRLSAAPLALRLAGARAAGEPLRRAAAHRPLAIVLDDAQLVDDVTLDALEYATMHESSARVWICALALPSFERARAAWGSRAAVSRRSTLGALEPEHAMELARRLLLPVEHVPPPALLRLAERTRGIPRLIVELVRGLKREGLVRRSERGEGYYLATEELDKLPDLPIVEWNARRELEALPPQLASHARLASVLGQSFTVAELEELLNVLERSEQLDELQLDASVGTQRLIDAGVLVRHRSGLIDFRHALLRDTIYRSLSDKRRALLHRAAFELYQRLDFPADWRLPRLAVHATRSGEKETAAKAYLELGQLAHRAHAYLEAEAAFGGALENLSPEDARLASALRGRGLVRFRLGRHEDALKDLRPAREQAHARGDALPEAELLLDEAMVLDWTCDFEQSAELVHKAAAIQARSDLLAARLAMGRARVEHRSGHAEESVRLGGEAERRARQLDDAGYETRVIALLMSAPDCVNLGRLEQAEQLFDTAIREAERHGDLRHLGAALANRALLWFARRDAARVFSDLTRSAQIAREIGEPLLEYGALCSMAEVAYALEEYEGALLHTTRTLALARQLWGEGRELSTRELLFARIALMRGRPREAAELVARIEARLSAAPTRGDEAELVASDAVLLEMVRLRLAGADDTRWADLLERSQHLGLQPHEELELREARALAAHEAGHHGLARTLFEQALARDALAPSLFSQRLAAGAARLAASA